MRKKAFNHQGFTLVEMIVVIAIIAILAAVIIPTTAGFIDRARLSNDRQSAASMTSALQSAIILDEHLDVVRPDGTIPFQDVKDLINTFSDSPVSFDNAARATGFFYIPDGVNSRIEAWKYSEAPTEIELSNDFSPTRFLNLNTVQGNSPNCFWLDLCGGQGPVLISTTSNDPIVIIVMMINNGADSELINSQVQRFEGLLSRVLGQNTAVITNMKNLYDVEVNPDAPFSENNRIFISNSGWRTNRTFDAESPGNNIIQRVVFAPNIVHIPDLNTLGGFEFAEANLVLPRTVRSIEQGAFNNIKGLESVELNSNRPIKILGNKITLGNLEDNLSPVPLIGIHGQRTTYSITNVVGVEGQSFLVVNENGHTTLNFEYLDPALRETVTGYSITLIGDWYEIKIFTTGGFTHRAVTTAAGTF